MNQIVNCSDSGAAFETATKRLGRIGEELAAIFLERKNFRLVASNFTAPVGRNRLGVLINTEIDLIAYDDETLVFVEVKTRRSDAFAAPEANVDLRKQRQIIRAARAYRRIFNLPNSSFRYDVVSVLLPHENSRPEIKLLKNYWTEDKFRKNNWRGERFSS
jgi:putative endonuclease